MNYSNYKAGPPTPTYPVSNGHKYQHESEFSLTPPKPRSAIDGSESGTSNFADESASDVPGKLWDEDQVSGAALLFFPIFLSLATRESGHLLTVTF
jgi:hypothetical protein